MTTHFRVIQHTIVLFPLLFRLSYLCSETIQLLSLLSPSPPLPSPPLPSPLLMQWSAEICQRKITSKTHDLPLPVATDVEYCYALVGVALHLP